MKLLENDVWLFENFHSLQLLDKKKFFMNISVRTEMELKRFLTHRAVLT